MRIRNLAASSSDGLFRVSARVEWEDAPRPPIALFFETDAQWAEEAEPAADAFLTACILPAMRHGERRVSLEGPVCPLLADGLRAAVRFLRVWWGPPRRDISIEPDEGFRATRPRRPERAGLFLTGGIDSLHLLQRNRIDYPPEHRDSFRDALAVFGFFQQGPLEAPAIREAAAPTLALLSEIARESRLRLVPIVTNVSRLDPDYDFLAEEFIGAALCSGAHLFRKSLSSISLASGRNVRLLVPRGTHPLLDGYFGSSALEVRHVGIQFSRLERVRELCGWETAVRNLVVCLQSPPPPFPNCGRCEKCVRTTTTLLALGRLREARSFERREVDPPMIEAIDITPHVAPYWRDLLSPLRDAGHGDLAGLVERKLERAEDLQRWFADEGWRGRLRRADRRWLGGALLAARRWASPGPRS